MAPADPGLEARDGIFLDAVELGSPLLQEVGLFVGVVEGLVELCGGNLEPFLVEDESLLQLVDTGVREARDAIRLDKAGREASPNRSSRATWNSPSSGKPARGILLKYPSDQRRAGSRS